MQVSKVEDFDTHAVIGGGTIRAFEMAQTAEFFTVLSNTLYRDKKRALVREVLCNAWDAHVVSDQTARPVEISLSETELVIRDHGPGIGDDRIADIYCTYGKSTKASDESQTGGFGLGSKAPFAYTDHFTVASAHEGVRTIYAVSRGGSETGGRPGIRTMVSVPTDQSGLTVTIPVANPADKHEFEAILKEVVFKGGINAVLNGEPLRRRDYTGILRHGFALEAPSRKECMSGSFIEVLYGAVTYPLTTTDPTIIKLESELKGIIGGFSMILAAQPGSLSVTPSREALSYSASTTATITKLLVRARNMITAEMAPAAKRVTADTVAEFDPAKGPKHLNTTTEFSGLLIEPREIAYRLLRAYPGRIPSKTATGYAARALIAQMPEARRVLRRSIRGVKQSILISDDHRYCGYLQYEPKLENDIARFAWRRIRRLAMDLGLLRNVSFVGINDGWTEQSSTSLLKGRPDTPCKTILVGQSRQAALFHLSKIDRDILRKSFGNCSVAIITVPEKNGETRRKLAQAAKACGFEVMETYAAKPEPKQKPPARRFDTLGYSHNLNGCEPKVTDPKTYIVKSSQSGGTFPVYGDSLRLVAKEYPETAITYAAGVKALEKAGARNVIDLLCEEFMKVRKKRATLYAIAIENKFNRPQGYLGRLDEATTLARSDLRYAAYFWPDRATRDPEIARIQKIVRVVRGIKRGLDEDVQRALIEADAASRKLFTPIESRADFDAFERKHAYLEVIDYYKVANRLRREFPPEAVIALMRAAAKSYANTLQKLEKDKK